MEKELSGTEAGSLVEHWHDVLKSAVSKYGPDHQTDMMIEEMSELTKALLKFRRGLSRGESSVDPALLQNVLEEMADVQIMLLQMSLIYGDSFDLELAKLKRLEERINDD